MSLLVVAKTEPVAPLYNEFLTALNRIFDGRLDEATFRKVVLALLFISGATLIF